LGKVINPSLRDPYGFSDVVLRLIATYDRQLSDRKGALVDVDRRLGKLPGVKQAHTIDVNKRRRLIEGLMLDATLPKGIITPELMRFLKHTKRIPAHW
jgi:hypothetical protein